MIDLMKTACPDSRTLTIKLKFLTNQCPSSGQCGGQCFPYVEWQILEDYNLLNMIFIVRV